MTKGTAMRYRPIQLHSPGRPWAVAPHELGPAVRSGFDTRAAAQRVADSMNRKANR